MIYTYLFFFREHFQRTKLKDKSQGSCHGKHIPQYSNLIINWGNYKTGFPGVTSTIHEEIRKEKKKFFCRFTIKSPDQNSSFKRNDAMITAFTVRIICPFRSELVSSLLWLTGIWCTDASVVIDDADEMLRVPPRDFSVAAVVVVGVVILSCEDCHCRRRRRKRK